VMNSTALSDAPWETRVLSLVRCIEDKDERADVILEVMRRTPVPWSDAVADLIHEVNENYQR
jgi:hypothetical protein